MVSLPPLCSRHETRWVIASAARAASAAILLATVAATPWAFGGVLPWWRLGMAGALLAALIAWAVAIFADPLEKPRLPWIGWMPLLMVLLGALQVAPLSPSVAAVIAPEATALHEFLTPRPDSPEAIEEAQRKVAPTPPTASVYPCATRRRMTFWIMVTVAVILGANVFHGMAARLALFVALAGSGAAVAFFGVIQKTSFNGMIYWTVPLTQGGAPFGPFVNRNNAAGFLLICLGAAVTLLWMSRARNGGGPEIQRLAGGLYAPRPRRLDNTRGENTLLDPLLLWSAGLIAMTATGIVASMSRGGVTAMATSAVLLLVIVLCSRRTHYAAISFVGFALLVAGLLFWVGLTDDAQARLATLFDEQTLRGDARWSAWTAAWRAAAAFPFQGAGLGTFQYVDPIYADRYHPFVFEYAENVPIEIMVCSGFLGLGLMALAWFGAVGTAWRLLPKPEAAAVGIGGLFALLSVSLASLADFGLFLPANALALAVLLGTVQGLGSSNTADSDHHRWLRLPTILGIGLCLALAGSLLWSMRELQRWSVADQALRATRELVAGEPPDADALREGIDRLRHAVTVDPTDAIAQLRLARLHLTDYRLRTWEQLREAGVPADDAWTRTDPSILHATVQWMLQNDARAGFDALRAEPVARETLDPAYYHLLLARRACPLLPEVHILLAMLPQTVDVADAASASLARARRLNPVDAKTMFDCGALEWHAGNLDGAYESWKLGLTLSPRLADTVVRAVDEDFAIPGTVARALPDDPDLLIRLAERHYSAPRFEAIREQFLQRATELIEIGSLPEDQREYLLARVCLSRNDRAAAIRHLGRAVLLRPMEAEWHYHFARLLLDAGDSRRAHEHARRSVRLKPSIARYQNLLEQATERVLRAEPPQEAPSGPPAKDAIRPEDRDPATAGASSAP